MSLEDKLAANTAALEANVAAMQELTAMWAKLTAAAAKVSDGVEAGTIAKITAGGVPVAEVPQAPKQKADKPADTPAAPVTATTTPTEVAAPAPVTESRSEPPKEATMEQLSAAVTSAATRNRDAVIRLLSERGVKRASELPKDQWADIITVLGTF